MPYTMGMFSFIESIGFTRLVGRYLTDADQRELQLKLLEEPRAGAVIPGSGGIRKLRWRGSGRGKRGGTRIIYAIDWTENTFLLLTVYGKNERDDIPLHLLKRIREQL